MWNRGIAAFDRVFEVLNAPVDIADLEDAQPLPKPDGPRGHIALRNVDFSYVPDTPTLRNINMDIPAGSKVAIVGKTGSGKTTVARLMCRLWDPDRGTVEIDGVPFTKLSLRETRSEIGVVPQDPFLFSMSIGDNVRFGLDALEDDPSLRRAVPTTSLFSDAVVSQETRIDEALEIAGMAGELSSFSAGLETLVGERGVTLSGGQKQRVTIARALVMDPRILILDDALASVDTQTETAILDHLDRIMSGRTSVIITHRFNALARVDKIFVMDEGQVVEVGTHDELLRAGGIYAELCERQKLQEELEA
ncbi:MAG: ABC transporter ATP-binding protein [bacterium]